ncbi:very-long-chain aldehyde decarbonylase GL1-5 [Glycine max]|uniref:very-long-chain aldehyde decarbonylase GL1-5 n=1 Tax=Glycine max TaxID=3847 RepID=UPI001B357EFC|nr:very-long-chain aldehyde decarbonylase GL1-5 [Glycine max]
MPFYDYIYGTMDKASDQLHDSAIKQEEEIPDVVHLAHLTTPEWWLCLMRPVTAWSMILTWVYGQTFIVEGNRFDKLKLQTRAIPKYSFQIWLVGDELTEEEQLKVPKGAFFIPFSQFPPRKYRKDCSYQYTPAMLVPSILENVHSCEVCSNNLFFVQLIQFICGCM